MSSSKEEVDEESSQKFSKNEESSNRSQSMGPGGAV
jgi:hypothetical protein